MTHSIFTALSKIIRHIWPIALIVVISSIVFHTWVFSFAPVTAGDWGFNDEVYLKEFLSPPNIINFTDRGGADLVGLAFYPFQFYTALLSHWGFTYSMALRFVFLYPIAFMGPIGFFLLLNKITRSRIASFVGALTYTYNTYFLTIDGGHLTLMMAFSLFPLIFLLYLKSIESRSFKKLLITGLLSYVASFYEVRGFYLISLILISYALFHIFIVERERSLINALKSFAFYLTPIILVLLLSLYWLFGLFAIKNTSYSYGIFHVGLFGRGFMSAIASLGMFHPFWAGDTSIVFVTQTMPLRFWLFPLFAILGYWANRRNKFALFFGIIAFLGILLSKQGAEPLENLYGWLFQHVPGFAAFRESSKFYFYIAVGYSGLIAFLVAYILKIKNRVTPVVSLTIICLLLGLSLWNTRGQITGTLRGLSVLRQMPEDYLILKQFILSQNQFFRILWLPYYSRWIPNYPQNPKLAANGLYFSPWNLINPDLPVTVKTTEGERISDMLYGIKAQRLLNMSGVRYVFIPLLDKANDDDFFFLFNEPRDYYLSYIKQLSYLKPVITPAKEVQVYYNESAKPKIYITSEPESIDKDISATPISYQRLSASEYLISLGKITDTAYLQFSQTYDPNWKIFSDSATLPKILFSSPIVLSSDHDKNIAGFNAFKIDPSLSGRTLKLYYFPQAYVIVGWLISIVIGITALGIITLKRA